MTRFRDKKHLHKIAGRDKPCMACGAMGTQAAHISRGHRGGMGLKASDALTVPLCRECHDLLDGRYTLPGQSTHAGKSLVLADIAVRLLMEKYEREIREST